jgi:hypothetical protein
MTTETAEISDEEQILAGGDIPDQFQRELKSLGDIARNPLHKPLTTLAALLILTGFVYQAGIVAVNHHPISGLAVIGIAGVAYHFSKRMWAIQHRHMVRKLARAGELDRLRD